MRPPTRILLQLIIVITFTLASLQVTAGSPPDPGGTPVGGGPPVGGGAPIGSGTVILIVAAAAYGAYKTKFWQKQVKNCDDC